MSRPTMTTLALLVCLPLTITACTTATENPGSSTAVPSVAVTTQQAGAGAALVPQKIKDKGEIAFAHDATYPPFEYFDKDNTTMIGFDVELADAVAGKLGLRAKHVNTGFDTILAGLGSGKFDAGIPTRATGVRH